MDTNSSSTGRLFEGAAAQRIEISKDVAVLQLRRRGETWVVVVSSRVGGSGVAVLGKKSLARARALMGGARSKLPSAGVLGLDAGGVWLVRAGRVSRIAIPMGGRGAEGLALVDAEVKAGASDLESAARASEIDAWAAAGPDVLARIEGASLETARRALFESIDREDKRLVRRIDAVTADLERGQAAERTASAMRAFVSAAAGAPRGTTALMAQDWSSGEPVSRTLTLDPGKRPLDQLEAAFAKARRLKKGSIVARARLDEAHAKRARLFLLRSAASSATRTEELTEAQTLARREDPALFAGKTEAPGAAKRAARSAPPRVPYHAFISTSGTRVLVGKGASDNDELTLRVARPHDLWLHAKGEAGAHVVVPLDKGREPAGELLIDAAHLAAHFSDARGESVVEVTYVARRHVRKPRGAAPGLVHVDRERVLVLRVDAGRLALLLARKER